jgi:hypothetical protein
VGGLAGELCRSDHSGSLFTSWDTANTMALGPAACAFLEESAGGHMLKPIDRITGHWPTALFFFFFCLRELWDFANGDGSATSYLSFEKNDK